MLLLHVCSLCLSLLVAAELVTAALSDNFEDCRRFFYMQTPPAGPRGTNLKRICQKYNHEPRYAALYDGGHRVPLYSAYVYKKSDGRRRADTPWMYEPQLASADESGNMRVLPPSAETPPAVEDSQTVLEDYVDAVEYRRSALNPDLHQAELDDKSSTYTLTNVVPLIIEFFESSWSPYLETIRQRLNNFCHGRSFVVTGVTLAGAVTRRNNRERLTAPKYVWLGYCCPEFDRNSPYEVRFMFPGYGGYGLNEHSAHGVVEVPLKTLERFLRSQADGYRDVRVFHRGCMNENDFRRRRRRDLIDAGAKPDQ